MRYVIDHDFHIHSNLSTCACDPLQTPENILKFAKQTGLKTICLTDHYWDETVPGVYWEMYVPQDTAHILQALPLPQDEDVSFLFGCEADMDKDFVIGLSPEKYDMFDFIVIATTHTHCLGCAISDEDHPSDKRRAELWCERFEKVLNTPLPFHKVGIAHLACSFVGWPTEDRHLRVLNMIPSADMESLFTRAAQNGMGIELNRGDIKDAMRHPDEILRPFKIAKQCGCRFYLGSDAHTQAGLQEMYPLFNWIIDALELQEADKFIIGK